jgi:flotillin
VGDVRDAEAKAIRARGEAEAEAMRLKAEAFKQYNEAAVTQMIIEKLPELAQAIANPLSKTEKIVIVDSGSGNGKGAAKVTDYVSQIMATLPETVKGITGVDLLQLLSQSKDNTGDSEQR